MNRQVVRLAFPPCISQRCPDREHLMGIETDYLAKFYRPIQVTVSSIPRHHKCQISAYHMISVNFHRLGDKSVDNSAGLAANGR